MSELFSPDILQAGTVKGLIQTIAVYSQVYNFTVTFHRDIIYFQLKYII